MIFFKPLPSEKPVKKTLKIKKRMLSGFTTQAISKAKLDKSQISWVAMKVARMLEKKQGELTDAEINTIIEYTRFLLSKMQLLKSQSLSRIAKKLFSTIEKKQKMDRKKMVYR